MDKPRSQQSIKCFLFTDRYLINVRGIGYIIEQIAQKIGTGQRARCSNLDEFALGSAAGTLPGGRKLLKGNFVVLRGIIDVTAYRALPFTGQ
jgi:hypothetical protein